MYSVVNLVAYFMLSSVTLYLLESAYSVFFIEESVELQNIIPCEMCYATLTGFTEKQ